MSVYLGFFVYLFISLGVLDVWFHFDLAMYVVRLYICCGVDGYYVYFLFIYICSVFFGFIFDSSLGGLVNFGVLICCEYLLWYWRCLLHGCWFWF